MLRDFPESLYGGWRDRANYREVDTYCLFIGYPRSGHSVVGSFLDAHPDMLFAHQLGDLKYIRGRYGRRQLYYLIVRNSRRFMTNGRVWAGYSYEVPNQWQGRWRNLRVIGDKQGSGVTR